MNELIFDTVLYIASFNPETWFRLMRINNAFALYARADAGKREYVRLFALTTYVNDMAQTSLFGIIHSIYDDPAITHKVYSEWYMNGVIHRDCDKPAFIYKENRYEKWYKNGKLHRDNDLPVVVDYRDSVCVWFLDGNYIKSKRYHG